jgi:hypothetical protein
MTLARRPTGARPRKNRVRERWRRRLRRWLENNGVTIVALVAILALVWLVTKFE